MAQSLGGIASCLLWDNLPEAAHADDAPLTEEEMAARVARKLELQKMAAQGQPAYVKASDVRSDVNPEAGADLRSRSFADNARISMAKQEELKKRDNSQKRGKLVLLTFFSIFFTTVSKMLPCLSAVEDLCEMLGRGC